MAINRKEFPGSRTRVQHGALLSIVLALIGIVSLLFAGSSVQDADLVGYAALLMAAGVMVSVVRSARDRNPRMILDRGGVWFQDWKIRVIPWPAIREAHIGGSRLQAFILLSLRDPEGFLNALPEAERKTIKSNRLWRSPELRIPHGALDAPHDEILAAIKLGIETANPSAAPAHEPVHENNE